MKTISKLLKEKGLQGAAGYKIYKQWKKLNNSTIRCTTWLNLPADQLNEELLEQPKKTNKVNQEQPAEKPVTQKPIKFRVEYFTPNGGKEIKYFDIIASGFALSTFNKLMRNHGYEVYKMTPVNS